MRGEQCVGTQLREAFSCRPGQRQAVEGTGAASDFVHQYQTFIGGVVQDVCRFAHFDHERRAPARQVVAGADAGEDPVDQRQFAAGSRDEAADMGQQHDQRRLAHISRFTAHVRAGDDQHARAVVQRQVVGNERRAQNLFNDRMATLLDAHARFGDKAWAIEVQVQRALRKVAQHVQFGQGRSGILKRRKMADQVFEQCFVEHLFPSQRAALGRQRLVFELLELGRDKAFGTLQGLAAYVICRRLLGLLAWQLDKIAMHAVVADFQVAKTGAGFFAGFQVDQELTGVFAQRLQIIQFSIVASLQDAAVADDRRRIVDDRTLQQVGQLGIGAGRLRKLLQVRRVQIGHRLLQFGQGAQCVAQACEVTWPRVTQADTRQNPLDVTDFLELRLQVFEAIAFQKAGDRRLACLKDGQVAQRPVQPARKQACPHRGLAAVHDRLQRVVTASGQVGVQFQVTATGCIEDHGIVETFVTQAA